MKIILSIFIASLVVLGGCSAPSQPQGDDNTIKQESPANESSETLDLSQRGLAKIPGYVFGMRSLKELDVSNNSLSGAIQAEIRQLSNLRVLRASNNQMTGVPAEIGQLANLEFLDLSNNQLTGLPYELGNLQNLKTLNISGNNYSTADLAVIEEKLPDSVTIIK